MINVLKRIKSKKKDLREFGFIVGGVFVTISLIGLFSQRGWASVLIIVGSILMILGAVAPRILLPFQKAWMVIAIILGAVMSRVILTIVYFLVVTPIGLFLRIIGKHFIDLEIHDDSSSYWMIREAEGQESEDSERQF